MKHIQLTILVGLFANLSMHGAAAATAGAGKKTTTKFVMDLHWNAAKDLNTRWNAAMWDATQNNNITELNKFLVSLGKEKARDWVNYQLMEKDNSPLLEAIDYESVPAVNILLAYGADPARPVLPFCCPPMKFPIHRAVGFANTDIVKSLLSHNKSLANAKDDYGNTPLMHAVRHGRWTEDDINRNINVINNLLNHGAGINIRNVKGETALSLAQDPRTGNPAIAAFLRAHIAAQKDAQRAAIATSDFGVLMPNPEPKPLVDIAHGYLSEN